MSLISRTRRSVFCTAIWIIRCARSGSGPSTPLSSSPSEPRIDVSGVRSSWLTTDVNSSLTCSSSRRSRDVVKDHDGAADAAVLRRSACSCTRPGRSCRPCASTRPGRSGGSRRPAATRASGSPRSGYGVPSGFVWCRVSCRLRPVSSPGTYPVMRLPAGFMNVTTPCGVGADDALAGRVEDECSLRRTSRGRSPAPACRRRSSPRARSRRSRSASPGRRRRSRPRATWS